MLSMCWETSTKLRQFDAALGKTMGQLLRYTASRYHVQQYYQQSVQKHTLSETVVDENTTPAARNSSKPSQMKTTTTSVFSSHSKEESYQQMQLKHLQYMQKSTLQKSEMPTAATTPTTTSSSSPPTTPSTPPTTTTTPPTTTATTPVHIPNNIDWIFKKLANPNGVWLIFSQICCFCVGLFSKIVLSLMNTTRVYNKERLLDAIGKRPSGVPLVTVSNHHSCFDDPGLWSVLPMWYVGNTFKIRWIMAAHDICFTNKFHASFFMFGKCIPVIRGIGVYQDAIDICIKKVKLGDWVHVFPEGKVNMTKEEMRLKWGVGRIIYESPRVPLILPMWHEGMDEVLPNVEPYIFKWGKRVTLNIGKPIDMNDFINDLKTRGVPEPEARKLITDKIQDVFRDLRYETQELHNKHK